MEVPDLACIFKATEIAFVAWLVNREIHGSNHLKLMYYLVLRIIGVFLKAIKSDP